MEKWHEVGQEELVLSRESVDDSVEGGGRREGREGEERGK